MAWYHWIAVYMIIISGGTFFIVPDKPLWLWGLLGLMVTIGLLMGVLLPHKEDKYANMDQKRAE